MSRNRKNTI